MKRKATFILVLALALLCLSVVAFAASDGTGGFFSTLSDLKRFIASIFVPEKNYFHNKLANLSGLVNDRFGGLAYLYQMINHFFESLKGVPDITFMVNIPSNFLYRGYKGFSIDFFTGAKPYISFVRNFLTAGFAIFTATICYKKLLSFFKS